ncbi:MAG: SRPBCC family protein [Gemmatimonadaceae bacterium]
MPHRPALIPAIDPSAVIGSSFTALLAALSGGILLGARPREDGRARPIATLAGLALLGVAAHRPIADALRTAGTKRRSGALRFSFVVNRPVEEVFRYCADFENFPQLITTLREVRDNGDGRSHWCATTPGGGEIEWDAVTTKFVTNSVIGWQNTAGAPLATTGVLRFSPEDDRTCVRVAIEYRVVESGMGDALAALVKPPRTHELEADIRNLEQILVAQRTDA